MADQTMRIKGIEELRAKLGNVAAGKWLRGVMAATALTVKGKAARYPAATSANMPGPYPKRWYQRGYGPRWARAGGGVGGRKTSQQLGKRWSAQVSNTTAVIYNTASYAEYVQGRGRQAKFHSQRGWRTLEDVADEQIPAMEAMAARQAERAMGK